MFDAAPFLHSFQEELTKEALAPLLRRVAPALGSGVGIGGTLGGVGGALHGGVKGYREARREGAGGGLATIQGLERALGSGAKGALLGATTGAAGLAGARALGSTAGAGLAAREGFFPALARFGQRQLHGFTGWKPQAVRGKGGLRSIRGGAWDAEKRLATMQQAYKEAPTPANLRKMQRAEKYRNLALESEAMGLTSIPGYAKSLVRQPGKTLRTGMGEVWHGMEPIGRGLIFGLPAYGTARALTTEGAPGEGGRLERAGEQLGMLAYGLGPMPIMSQLALQPAISGGLKRVGRLAQRKRPAEPPSPPGPVEPGGGMTQAEDRVYTDRAAANL